LKQDRHALPPHVRYLATDGFYSKKKYIDDVAKLDLYQIGKVKFNDLTRLERAGELDGFQLYTLIDG
jgi:hypothetical protein